MRACVQSESSSNHGRSSSKTSSGCQITVDYNNKNRLTTPTGTGTVTSGHGKTPGTVSEPLHPRTDLLRVLPFLAAGASTSSIELALKEDREEEGEEGRSCAVAARDKFN